MLLKSSFLKSNDPKETHDPANIRKKQHKKEVVNGVHKIRVTMVDSQLSSLLLPPICSLPDQPLAASLFHVTFSQLVLPPIE